MSDDHAAMALLFMASELNPQAHRGRPLRRSSLPGKKEPMSTTEVLSFVFGTVFMATLLGIAVAIMLRDRPVPSEAMFIFRVVLALAAGGVGAVLPGLINLQVGSAGQVLIQAGGALALTVLVYLFNPPTQVEKLKAPKLPRPKVMTRPSSTLSPPREPDGT